MHGAPGAGETQPMPNYKFEIQEPAGRLSSGVVTASSVAEASAMLRGRGYLMNIAPVTMAAAGNDLLGRMQKISIELGPGLKDILNFTNQLAVMIKAGINIRNAIGSIAEQVSNQKFKRMIEQMKADVESGKPFSDSLARFPKTFSPLYVNMVKASELSGNFGHMLERISEYLGQQVETRAMVRGAMVYPCIIGIMAITTTVFLLTFVLPTFTKLFAGKEAALPKPTVALMAISEFMRSRWYVLLGGTVAGIWGFIYTINTAWGHEKWDWIKIHIPLFKRMLKALYISRGLHTMGELVNAGVPMLDTLNITAEVSGNTQFKAMWQNVHNSVKQGDKIAKPLQRQFLLPRNVVQMISAGEESGKLGEVLSDVAEYYAMELRTSIKAVTSMIEPIMIVVMGLLVGFIAMSIMLPIFKMSSLVK